MRLRICLLNLVIYWNVSFAKWLVAPSCVVFNQGRAWISPNARCNTNLPTKECRIPCRGQREEDFPFYWMISDPDRNLVVTGVPKVGISSTRTELNQRCQSATANIRCAEFRRNSSLSQRINLNTSLRAMMMRDPADRVAAAWRDMSNITNRHIYNEFAPHGCYSTGECSFPRFVQMLKASWSKIGRNEHFIPQHRIARAGMMHYHFIGLLHNSEDVATYWNVILNASEVLRKNQGEITKPFTKAEISQVWPIIWELYADDYSLIRSLGMVAPSDPQTPL